MGVDTGLSFAWAGEVLRGGGGGGVMTHCGLPINRLDVLFAVIVITSFRDQLVIIKATHSRFANAALKWQLDVPYNSMVKAYIYLHIETRFSLGVFLCPLKNKNNGTDGFRLYDNQLTIVFVYFCKILMKSQCETSLFCALCQVDGGIHC